MKKTFLKEIISFIKILIISYIAGFLITTFIVKPVVVSGISMEPTLEDRDIGFSYVITKRLFGINRGDIVTVYVAKENQYLVKRVIGLPNETIYAKDDTIYIDDKPLSENYLDTEFVKNSIGSSGLLFTNDFSKLKIPEGHYFLMGDNRIRSRDSREYGPFPYEDIVSNSIMIVYPFKHFGMK